MMLSLIASMAIQAEPRVLTYADFIRQPMPEVPEAALSRGISTGSATVECDVQGNRITTCKVINEDPPELRFGLMLISELRRSTLRPEVASKTTRFRMTARFLTRAD
jgi:hypothetical protein